MRKMFISILLIVVSACSISFAETRQQHISPKGKKFTLILMTQSEFDDFLLKKFGYNNISTRTTGGKVVLGITSTHRKRIALWDDPKKWWNNVGKTEREMERLPFAWFVRLPVDACGNYEEETYAHEVFYHVDNDIRHPVYE